MTRSRLRTVVRSIRTRIVVGYVVLVAVSLVITALVFRSALQTRFASDVDSRLAAEVAQLELVIDEGDPETGDAFSDAEILFETHLRRVLPGDDAAFFTLVDGVPFRLSFDAPDDLLSDTGLVEEWASLEQSAFATVDSEAGPVRVLALPVRLEDGAGTFVAAVFTQNGRDDVDSVIRTLLLVGVVVMLVSALVAASIASRVARPVRELTGVARSITGTDLAARIPADGDDELAELSLTFNAMLDRLEQGFAAQRAFLDDVAHELRTPITIIQGHLEVLGDDPVERRETVALLQDELDRMNRYVDDLLVLAQADRPDFLRPAPAEIGELTTELHAKVAAMADRRWVVDAAATGAVELDRQRLTQAVLNLAHNAVRHTSAGDEIGVGTSIDPPVLRVWVRDTGTGVDPDLVDRLFERHVRSGASRAEGGTGLGLSIVDAIAVAHGGRVVVESTVDVGATFTIEVPLERGAATGEEES